MIFVQTACVQCVTEIIDGAAQQLLRSVAQKRSHSLVTIGKPHVHAVLAGEGVSAEEGV